jgi:hypothetical protein
MILGACLKERGNRALFGGEKKGKVRRFLAKKPSPSSLTV